jgi:hypothetical protein
MLLGSVVATNLVVVVTAQVSQRYPQTGGQTDGRVGRQADVKKC